jgi:4-amino-4-deoxy-L-arabinose transferase-like glycosyltransferase
VQPLSPADQPTPPRFSLAGIAWTILILATLYCCYFSHLGIVGFVGPDEPRYAWIARDMAESGDWVTPRLYGKPWFEKPPFYYWGAAVSFKLFGVTEAAARLPSAVCALLATVAMAWLAWRVYGAETARWVLLVLPPTVGMIGFSHAAATDMPFSAMLTIAMVAAALLLNLIPQQPSTPSSQAAFSWPSASFIPPTSFTSVLFGLFLGLAVLAKGPAAVMLCAGAIFFWALFMKRWRDTLRLLHPVGILAFCLTALPWYIACASRNPDFLRVFLIEHNFKRFLTPEFQHIQPFWFYAEILPLAFLPWIGVLIWTLIAGLRRIRTGRLSASSCFLLCWAAFCVVFFTISRSKLPGYILPAVPPIALILARFCTSLGAKRYRPLGLTSLVCAAVFAFLFLAVQKHERLLGQLIAFAPLIGLILIVLALANLLLGVFVFFSRRSAALITSTIPVFLGFGLLDTIAAFTPFSILSPRYAAYQIQADQVPPQALRVTGIRRATVYGLNFYLRTDLQEWDHDSSREVYLLAVGPLPCPTQAQDGACSDLWQEVDKIGDFQLLHLTPKR